MDKQKDTFEELLNESFLKLDLEATENHALLDATSGAVFGKKGLGAMSFGEKVTSTLFNKWMFISVALIGTVGFWMVQKGSSENLSYTPQELSLNSFQLDNEDYSFIVLEENRAEESKLKKEEKEVIENDRKKIVLPILVEEQKEVHDLLPPIEKPEEITSLLTLTEEDIEQNNKEKAKLLRELAKLDKDRITEVEVFVQFVGEGTERMDDFMIWNTEVTNKTYRLFLKDLIIQGRMDDYRIANVEDEAWMTSFDSAYLQPMVDNYFMHPAYDDYPVVNISRKGANLFCEWLSSEIRMYDKNNRLLTVEIPTDKEWKFAASSGGKHNTFPWGGQKATNAKACYLANYYPSEGNYAEDGGLTTVSVNSYIANEFGLYNTSGNVSEMVNYKNDEIGALGGNWLSKENDIKISAKDSYKGVAEPKPYIGFRPIIKLRKQSVDNWEYSNNRRPYLTIEQIKGNNKRKNEMVRAVLKLNHTYYTNLIRGSVTIDGKTETVTPFIMKKMEVSNVEYKTYLFDLIVQKKWKEFEASKPNQELWRMGRAFYEPMVEHYFSHKAYENYPVVNIPVNGAEGYCKWLFDEAKKQDKRGKLRALKNIRLPSNAEWIYAASYHGKYKFPWGTLPLFSESDQPVANFLMNKEQWRKLDNDHRFIGPAPVNSFKDYGYGMFHMSGNVAEMVRYNENEYGSKGGSWKSLAEQLNIYTIDTTRARLEAGPTIGFRPIFEWDNNNSVNIEESPLGRKEPYLTFEEKQKMQSYKTKMIASFLEMNKDKISKTFNKELKSGELLSYRLQKTEVSNVEYRTFLYDLIAQKRYEEFEMAKPDVTLWRTKFAYNEPYVNYYFTHPAYDNYPMVNVSVKGAKMYCKWLFEEIKKGDVKNEFNAKAIQLPTEKEWLYAASCENKYINYPWEGNGLENKSRRYKGQRLANYKSGYSAGEKGNLNNHVEITAPCYSYWPTEVGLYNIVGNVSEMIIYSDGAYGSKGGSWRSEAEELKLYTEDKTKGNLVASPFLGFRVLIKE